MIFVISCSWSIETLSSTVWDPVPQSGSEPGPLALGVWSLSPVLWTTRDVPVFLFFWNVRSGPVGPRSPWIEES